MDKSNEGEGVAMPENPQAFPRTGEGFGNPLYDEPGMTLRDYFAGHALAGCLAAPGALPDQTTVTRWAYAYADAMLAARMRPDTTGEPQ